MTKIEFHIGIDDTDSSLGGCTTYTGTILFQSLLRAGFEPRDFPWLVRLNPNIPWKTRGNGAVALHLNIEEDQISSVKRLAISIVEEHSDLTQARTDPAIVFLESWVPENLRDFSRNALDKVLTTEQARRLCRLIGAEAYVLKGPRGIVGALAAVGASLECEETFEIIAYRSNAQCGKPRRVSPESVARMDLAYGNVTFNNIDPETGRVLICPRGPDPVLYGIRGDNPASLVGASKMIVTEESVETISIFRTNAGTDAHLQRPTTIKSLVRYQSAVVTGSVQSVPRSSRGGHVFFRITDHSGSITCAAFRPTGTFRIDMLQLVPGDKVRASGGVQLVPGHGLTLNLEKLEVVDLADSVDLVNPLCVACGTRCESQGEYQGFRCRRCSMHYPHSSKVPVRRERGLEARVYLPPPRAHRHLTRPLTRRNVIGHETRNHLRPWTGFTELTVAIAG